MRCNYELADISLGYFSSGQDVDGPKEAILFYDTISSLGLSTMCRDDEFGKRENQRQPKMS